MTNEQGNSGQDQVIAHGIHWDLGVGSAPQSEILWQCDALRAGKLYNRSLFGTKQEADEFVEKMRRAEPDQMFNVEAIKASTVWN